MLLALITVSAFLLPALAAVTGESVSEGNYDDAANDLPEPKPYTPDDVIMLAKTVWGEARGCSPDEQALVVWTVLNRVDDGRFGATIAKVITRRHQFKGYKKGHPVKREILAVVMREVQKWSRGEEPPLLPPYAKKAPYLYFSGRRGHNWFR